MVVIFQNVAWRGGGRSEYLRERIKGRSVWRLTISDDKRCELCFTNLTNDQRY